MRDELLGCWSDGLLDKSVVVASGLLSCWFDGLLDISVVVASGLLVCWSDGLLDNSVVVASTTVAPPLQRAHTLGLPPHLLLLLVDAIDNGLDTQVTLPTARLPQPPEEGFQAVLA